MGKGGGQTVGYHYGMTLLSGLWRGPINALMRIRVGDKIAWSGEVSDATPTPINKPSMFGGEQKEGGIQGGFRLFQGADDQVLPGAATLSVGSGGPFPTVTIPDIKASIGGRVSEFRGVVTVLYRGLLCSMNPYPKVWEYCGYRTTAGWDDDDPWYPEKATIWMAGDGLPLKTAGVPGTGLGSGGGLFGEILRQMRALRGVNRSEPVSNAIPAMNPAHIIYECRTNREWGAARPRAALYENSFILAANTLCEENFGLCFNWQRQEDVDSFVQVVINHIGAVLYTDRETGLEVLRLIRDDYDIDDLPLYTFDTGLLTITEDDSASSEEAINEVVIKGKDPIDNSEFEVREHNIAARQAEGAISQTIQYQGLPTRALAKRVAKRELRVHASGLKKFRLEFDRRAWRLVPGGVIRIAAPNRDISEIVLRLAEVDHGSTDDSIIKVRAVEDVFGMPETAFGAPTVNGWIPPPSEAEPAAATRLFESNWRDLFLRLGSAGTADITAEDCHIGQLAASPGYAQEYDLATQVTGEASLVVRATGPFTGTGLLAAAVEPLDTVLVLSDNTDITDVHVGQALLIAGATPEDDEEVRLDAISGDGLTLTVARGCADTVPRAHASGARLWTVDDDAVSDVRAYAEGETVTTAVLTRTDTEVLEIDDVTPDTLEMVNRQDRPLPPGDVQVDGDSIYAISTTAHPEPVLTWVHRDRLLQQDQLVSHGEAGVGPEAGTTYTLRFYDSADPLVVIRTEAGIAGTTFTYDATMQTADGNPTGVWIEVESERDGKASYQHYRFFVPIETGYGFGWGGNWGGA